MKLLSTLIVFLVVLMVVSGFSTVEITAPSDSTYQSTLAVNISGGINVSAFPFLLFTGANHSNNDTVARHVINVTILTKTSSSGTYSILAASLPLTINATNGTPQNFWNYTATLSEGRNYVRLNFTNVSINDKGEYGGALTAERIIQIDTEPLLINFSGKLHLEGGNLSVNSGGGTRFDCGPNDSGAWSCS